MAIHSSNQPMKEELREGIGEVISKCLQPDARIHILLKGHVFEEIFVLEDLISSLLKSLESASGRSIAMVMAVIGAIIWWVVHLIRKGVRKVTGGVAAIVSGEPVGLERPRKRLSLREYH